MSNMGQGPQPGQPGAAPQGAPGGRPGQMTAVMRAVAQQAGPKVLRIALVQSGKVVEERIIKNRTTVTVGANEKANFVVTSNLAGALFKLFELKGSEYSLNFVEGMTGRVALQTGISDLASLRGQAKKEGNAYQIRLTEEARGKVVIGDSTFLFQFVAPPPPQPKPQLPLAVKGGLASQIDWNLMVIAAFSFLLHFGLVGAMFSDWMDPSVNDDFNAVSLADLAKSIPPAAVETPPETPTTETKTAADTKTTPQPAGGAKPAGAGNSAKPAGQVSDKQAAKLQAEAEQLQMAMLAATGGSSAVAGALNRSDVPTPDLSGIAASGAGVGASSGDLKIGGSGGGGMITPGKSGNGLSGIGNTGGGGTGAGAGTEAKTKGPTGEATVGATSMSVPVANAERVVAGLRPKFKACYQKGLASDPGMSGSVKISAKISPNGEVDSATNAGGSGLSPDVVQCIQKAVQRAQFDAPGGSGSTIVIPVTFVQQGK